MDSSTLRKISQHFFMLLLGVAFGKKASGDTFWKIFYGFNQKSVGNLG
jgi:hypothetical protein